MIRTATKTLEDGRILEVFSNDASKDRAVIFHHGTPSDASLWNEWLEYLESRGIGAIAYSRAGYGKSSRRSGRRVISANYDTLELVKDFEVGTFVSLGWSGGGPHALANTLIAQCRGVITLAGVAKFGARDLDFLTGMGEENEVEFAAAVAGESQLTEWMNQNAIDFAKVSSEDLKQALGGLISQPDKEILTDHYAENMAATFRSGLANGYWGWFDDDLAFVQDWGFELSEISKPVELWQGDQDLMVPHSHGIWLNSKLPNSKLVFKPGEGHLSLGENARDEITHSLTLMLS